MRMTRMTRMTSRSRRSFLPTAGLGLALAAGAMLCLAPAAGAVLRPPATAGAASSPASPPPVTPAPAAPTGRSLRGFVRDIDFILLVDGTQVPVELYKGESAGAIVLVSPRFPKPLVLRAERLWSVDPAKLQKHPDATLDLAADAVLTPRGGFKVTNDGVSFVLDGHRASVRHLEVPPLLGLRRLDEVTAHNPEYLASATRYAPAPQALAALRQERRPITVRIYYGSWCGHCRMLVPHAVKLEQQLRGANLRFEYFGLRNPLTDPEARKAGVTEIPTAIVTSGGRELGRIVSDRDWRALEVALRALLAAQPATAAGGNGGGQAATPTRPRSAPAPRRGAPPSTPAPPPPRG